MRREFNNQRSFPPVNVGDVLEVKIEAVGAKGDGIAKKNGFVIFVPGVQEGDEVRVKINRVLRKVGFAELVSGSEKPAVQKEEEETSEDYQDEKEQQSEDSENFGEEE